MTVGLLASSAAFAGTAGGQIVPLPLNGAGPLAEQTSDVVAGTLGAIEPVTEPVADVLAPVIETADAATEPAAPVVEDDDPAAAPPALPASNAGQDPDSAEEPPPPAAQAVVEQAAPEAGQAAQAVSEQVTGSAPAIAQTPVASSLSVAVEDSSIDATAGPASGDEAPAPVTGPEAATPSTGPVPTSEDDPAATAATPSAGRSNEPSPVSGATPGGRGPVAVERIDKRGEGRSGSRLWSGGMPASTVNAVVLALLGVGLFLVAAAALPRRTYAHLASVHTVDAQGKVAAVGAAILLGAAVAYFVN